MGRVISCDGPTCISWIKNNEEADFIELFEAEAELLFCSWDCLVKFGAVKLQMDEMPGRDV
jgi:hypothetical protein